MDGVFYKLMTGAMNQLGAIEYGGGSFFSSSTILSRLDWSLFMIMLLGYDDELGLDSLVKLNALLVAPVIEPCGGRNRLDCVRSAAGSSFKASS